MIYNLLHYNDCVFIISENIKTSLLHYLIFSAQYGVHTALHHYYNTIIFIIILQQNYYL